MKIAVVKLGARITWETDAAVAPGEAISICKALTKGGADVHVFTKILKKDTLHPSITWHDIIEDHDTTGLDALVIINGNVNFFGGSEDEAQILNYKIVNHFKGNVVYIMCDPELPFTQIWESVAKKPWGSKYKQEDIEINRNINVLSQAANLEAVANRWPKKGVPIFKLFHFPMDQFPLLNEWLDPVKSPTVDLLYGGTARGGRRIPNLFKWYWNMPADISVEIFGSIDATDFQKHPKLDQVTLAAATPPAFTGKVKYCDVLPKMNSSLAHLVTGDPSYEVLDLIPQRFAECVAAGNVVFIDAKMDQNKRFYVAESYDDKLLREFIIVERQEQLVEAIRALKDFPKFREIVIAAQRKALNFNAEAFCKSLVEVLIE